MGIKNTKIYIIHQILYVIKQQNNLDFNHKFIKNKFEGKSNLYYNNMVRRCLAWFKFCNQYCGCINVFSRHVWLSFMESLTTTTQVKTMQMSIMEVEIQRSERQYSFKMTKKLKIV